MKDTQQFASEQDAPIEVANEDVQVIPGAEATCEDVQEGQPHLPLPSAGHVDAATAPTEVKPGEFLRVRRPL